MTDTDDYPSIMDAIKSGIDVARRNPGSEDIDEYVAWCVLQELRRSGWTITKISN